MAKVRVNFDVKNTPVITKTIATRMGQRAVKMSKDMISKGLSPVKSKGRFAGYAATRKTAQFRKVRKSFKSKAVRKRSAAILKQREQGLYPWTERGRYPGKKVRPVNLSLNGWYLSHLTWWMSDTRTRFQRAFGLASTAKNQVVSVGFSSTTGTYTNPPKKVKEFFETHNEGDHPHVPQRKHLPTGQREQFAVSIMRELKRIIEARVKNMVIAENNKTRNKK